MKIDVFNHLFPRRFYDDYIDCAGGPQDIGKRVRAMPTIIDLDARFGVMDEFGEYVQIISLPMPPIETLAGPDRSPELARVANDGMAELTVKYPLRFPRFVASVALNNPDEAVAEAVRAVTHLGACGVQIFSNAAGKPLDLPEFLPLFEEMHKRDVALFLHPARSADMSDYASESKSRYEIWWTFGWPYETSAAMARLVFSGIFDKYPEIKIITHHMGAMIPYFEGRVGWGWDALGSRTSDENYSVVIERMKPRRPIDYFRKFYVDTALFGGGAATKCGLEFFGVDNVLFASDVPFEPSPGLYVRETIRCIEALELSPEKKRQIYRGNAEKLLGLSRQAQADTLPHSTQWRPSVA
jgi:predicted TIM-barrel fold metal-dependent hydrolase